MIDMPLSELKTYKGQSSCPLDFDAYWDEGIREITNIPPNVKMLPAAFHLKGFECFDLFYTSAQNVRIHAKLIKPAAAKLPIALHFHGYSGRAADWHEYLAFAAAGFCVAAMDCRGQAGLSDDVGGVGGNTLHGHIIRGLSEGKDHLLFRQIFLDTVQLANVMKAMPFADGTRICAYGGSQGGALTMACAALVPEVRQLAPMYPFLCDYKRILELNFPGGAYLELKQYLRMFDSLYQKIDETMNTLAYIDVVNFARKIKGETLLAVTLDDDECPPSTVFAAYNNITAPKDIRIYPHHGHESLPHFWDEVIQKFQRELCG